MIAKLFFWHPRIFLPSSSDMLWHHMTSADTTIWPPKAKHWGFPIQMRLLVWSTVSRCHQLPQVDAQGYCYWWSYRGLKIRCIPKCAGWCQKWKNHENENSKLSFVMSSNGKLFISFLLRSYVLELTFIKGIRVFPQVATPVGRQTFKNMVKNHAKPLKTMQNRGFS